MRTGLTMTWIVITIVLVAIASRAGAYVVPTGTEGPR
jgi:hypothetical protein